MPVDYYPNKSIGELQTILATLQDRQTKGALVEVAAGGVKSMRQVGRSGDARTETEILRVLYSLYLRDSANGGNTYANPYANRVRRTVPSYGRFAIS